jgi:hypothetical protein
LKRPAVTLAVLLLFVGAVFAATAGGASAKSSCGQQVIDDWYGSKTGQLSKTYPIRCYRDALDIVKHETDLAVYSNARSDILRAMQLALARKPSRGSQDSCDNPDTADACPSFFGGPDKANGGQAPGTDVPFPIRGRTKTSQPFGGLIPHSSSASSVPLPAIVLGAIAALLLALGATAYVARRRQLRRQTLRPRHANGRNP